MGVIMANDEGIPVFMIGRSAENGRILLPALKPKYDGKLCSRRRPENPVLTSSQVVHFCTSTAAARKELSAVLEGRQIKDPSTTLGSNTRRGASPQKPVALFVGAGFDRADYEAFRRDVGERHGITWVREEKTDIEGLDDPNNWIVRESIGRVPRPEVLVKSVTKCLGRDLKGER